MGPPGSDLRVPTVRFPLEVTMLVATVVEAEALDRAQHSGGSLGSTTLSYREPHPAIDHFFDHFGVRMRDRACASVMVNVLKWLKKRSDYKWLGSVAKVDVEGSNPFSRSTKPA